MSGGDGLRGRVLVIDGGSGRAARRFPPREGRPAPALTRILSAIAPQVLLATDGVDSVLLPSAVDADTVRDHLRAAARHQGPLLVHIGGHLVRDRGTGALALALDHDRLPWRVLEEELRLRPMQSGTLVIGDLSADTDALPQLRVQPSPLGAGLPLWAAVSPDATQVGTFTRALVEALHGGRPGAGERLTPEQLQQQVHHVLRPETQIVVSHAPGWQVFRNTSRRLGPTLLDTELPAAAPPPPGAEPVPATPHVPGATPAAGTTPPAAGGPALFGAIPAPGATPAAGTTHVLGTSPAPAAAVAPLLLLQRSPETVTVELPLPLPPPGFTTSLPHAALPADVPPFDMPPLPAHAPTVHLSGPAQDDLATYRGAIGDIVSAADGGEHARAVSEAIALERSAVKAHGTDSEPVLKLRQVRAHVTRLAGLQREATLLYRDVALSLLDTRGADDPETRQAAANAEACWRAIEDDAEARRLGPDLVRLRQALPDTRRLAAVERHLARLRGEPTATTPEDARPPSPEPAAPEQPEQPDEPGEPEVLAEDVAGDAKAAGDATEALEADDPEDAQATEVAEVAEATEVAEEAAG
ncbi:hypothetical protein ABH931_001428 [Streptacidiphilus sp. MAP12-33]|uniref:hypothetical protein n=1 Tax=Streptacidiphilus sp. MAP12-33 TaxID=3156266 RepID=UPI0035199DFA